MARRPAADFQAHRVRLARLHGPFQLDELETFEADRFQPVTVPVLLHRESFFLVATAVASLRRKGQLSPEQLRRRREHERRYGRGASRSAAVRRVLEKLLPLTDPTSPVAVESDARTP